MCLSNTVANLAQRVEALKGKYETMRLATLEWGKALDRHDRWIDKQLKRIMALEAAANNRQQDKDAKRAAAPAPADSLVERVASRLRDLTGADDDAIDLWHDEARAAIREMAAALIDWHYSDEVVRTAWEAAKWLEREAS